MPNLNELKRMKFQLRSQFLGTYTKPISYYKELKRLGFEISELEKIAKVHEERAMVKKSY